jgi:hypothetical protein
MNHTGCTPAALLYRQLSAARIRAFIGRESELAAFRAALAHRAQGFTVLYLHGPGGIGKSTLLLRFADESRRMGLPVSWAGPAPDHSPPDDACPAADPTDPPVILIDDFDLTDNVGGREQPERWLRDTLLPGSPVGTVIVVASRRPPSVAWRADLGWNDILLPLPIGALSPAESTRMLRAHDVPEERQESVRRLAGGNPLALRVAAQTVVADPDARTDEDLHRSLALSIYGQLIGDIPSRAHRHALEVCAHAATTNEDLLRAAIPGADAAELFDWLRDLPFVASETRGIYPTDLVRNIVETELRWRDADHYATMHSRVKEHLLERARGIVADAVLPFIADVIFVQRIETRQQAFFAKPAAFEVQEHHYEPADEDRVREIALRAEGAASAELVAFWLRRQPEAFRVYRRPGDRTAIAFFAQLRLSRPTDEELSTDPVVAAAWERTQSVMPMRPGEHAAVARFAVDPASYHQPSECMDLMQLRSAASVICDDALVWSVVVTPDPAFWAPTAERSHIRNAGPPITIDGRQYTLFSQYWGSMSLSAWSDAGDDIKLSRRPKTKAMTQHGSTGWTRAEFDQAVRNTLRSWRRPDILGDSPMAHSRMVAEAGGDDPVAALRRIFSSALDTLRDDPRQAKFHRVLTATFLDGAPTQEAAAERLGLPFSTYRRHLARGLSGLSALLWKAETHGISFLDSPTPSPAPG